MYLLGVKKCSLYFSGTALSVEQINLIGRLTKNITLLFDGDESGNTSFSFKSIDLILKEGMNVKIIMFPEGEDPDSYSKKLSKEEFAKFLSIRRKTFIQYKSELLNKNSNNDPLKRVESIKDIARSISVIPDRLLRSEYCKVSSSLLNVSEHDLLLEVSKHINTNKSITRNKPNLLETNINSISEKNNRMKVSLIEECEREILRLIFNYGNKILEFENEKIEVSKYIFEELTNDNISFLQSILQSGL